MTIIRRMGEDYSAADVVVTLAGMFDVNPSKLSYGTENKHEYSRGFKRAARAWRMGADEHSGKIALPLDLVSAIERAAPKHRLAYIRPFPISITFANLENEMITDIVIAKFQSQGRDIEVDGDLAKEFDLFVLDIKYNVV